MKDTEAALLESEKARADLESQVAALRTAAELAWTVLSAEPNVSPRARSRAMATIQSALEWGTFDDGSAVK